jgi:hypothetical protein
VVSVEAMDTRRPGPDPCVQIYGITRNRSHLAEDLWLALAASNVRARPDEVGRRSVTKRLCG